MNGWRFGVNDFGSDREFITDSFLNCICGEGEEETIVLNLDGTLFILNVFFYGE